MSEPVVFEEPEGWAGKRIAVVTLNAATRLNSLSTGIVSALRERLGQRRMDERIAIIVLHARSDKAFCAGGNLHECLHCADCCGDAGYA